MIDITIHVKKVTVFLTHGTDKVHVETDLPSPYPKGVDNSNLTIEFNVQSDHGEEYVKRNFGINPLVRDIR